MADGGRVGSATSEFVTFVAVLGAVPVKGADGTCEGLSPFLFISVSFSSFPSALHPSRLARNGVAAVFSRRPVSAGNGGGVGCGRGMANKRYVVGHE